MKKLLVLIGIFALILPLMFLGCDDGDDGAQGIQGEQGEPGDPGAGTAATPESCAVCHNDVESIHAATGVATVSNVAVDNVASLEITFDITVDGVPDDSFDLRRAYASYDNAAAQTDPPTLITTLMRETLHSTSSRNPVDLGLTLSVVSGAYTVTIPDNVVIDDAAYLIQLQSATSSERPVAVATWGADPLRDLVTDAACAACHGPFPAWTEKFSHYAVGGSDCQICHSQTTRSIGIISRDATGALVSAGPFFGTNLVEYIHGIHNSHHMTEGSYFRTDEDVDPNVEDRYSIGFPSNMRNCAVCHPNDVDNPDRLETVASAPVSYYLCMSCHQDWDGFIDHDGDPIMTGPLGTIHRDLDPTTVNCMLVEGCHGGIATADEAADFHDFWTASDTHTNSFSRGTDISYDNPDNVAWAIQGVTVSGDNVTFTWTATKLGAAVDPCNTDNNAGPVFTDLGAYLAYAKGDDWVNEFVHASSPGQPLGAEDLFPDLTTTCAANVATTTGLTIAPGTEYADKMLLAIGGKAATQGTFTIGTTPTAKDYFVRFSSPIYAFNMADGSAAAERREAVADAKCLACHRGTLYQHGGDRIDNEHMCVICHNPSSADKNNRLDRFQIVNADNTVNTDATYDGKTNETYDMRTMIHGIHGVFKRDKPWYIYRGRGIYGFPPPVYEERDGDLFELPYPKPTGWPTPPDRSIFGSTNGSEIAHNWIVVHYPKPPSECLACHNPGLFEVPDQTKAVALTVDPGADYPDQSDDIVRGPGAAACTACHNDAPVQVHGTDFGYLTNVTKEEMLDKAAQ